MATSSLPKAPRLPPRWIIRTAWSVHRGIYRTFRGRVGLWRPRPNGWGTLRLTTTGRRSGRQRGVILGYVEDGPNLVTLAMNGWSSPEPAWWLNLQADPDASVELKSGSRTVRAREATGQERDRLWNVVGKHSGYGDLDAFAVRRSGQTAVVVLEPR